MLEDVLATGTGIDSDFTVIFPLLSLLAPQSTVGWADPRERPGAGARGWDPLGAPPSKKIWPAPEGSRGRGGVLVGGRESGA